MPGQGEGRGAGKWGDKAGAWEGGGECTGGKKSETKKEKEEGSAIKNPKVQ